MIDIPAETTISRYAIPARNLLMRCEASFPAPTPKERSAPGHNQTHAPQQKGLFDHLIGAGEQRGRHRQAQRLGGLEIDREFDLR